MSTPSQVEVVREQLWQRAEQALQDVERIRKEVGRMRNKRAAYYYQTPNLIMEEATENMRDYSRIITEAERDE